MSKLLSYGLEKPRIFCHDCWIWVIEALVWSNFWVLAKMLHLSLKV